MKNPRKKKEKRGSGGAICGGVMSYSQEKAGMKKYGVWYGMTAFKMPDQKYNWYVSALKRGNKKRADEIFKRYAYSSI